jgi:hypothetical protein
MQKNIKTFQPFRLLAIIFLAATLITACKNKESKTTEVQSTEVKKDTLPALDKKDTLSTTRPETIKN